MTDSVTSTPTAETVHEVVIIGSGPAGLTAAIYTARANLAPVMIEGEPSSTSDQPGGQLMLTTEVENFPGFRDGIMGPDLMAEMRAQAERFGTTIVTEKVNAIDFSERPFTITDPRGDLSGQLGDRVDRCAVADARPRGRGAPDRTRPVDVRHVRRLLLPRPRDRRRRWRRLGDRRGELPHEVRRQGDLDRATRRVARLGDHAGPCQGQPEDRVPLEHVGDRHQRHRHGARASNIVDNVTGETGVLDVTGIFIAIGHKPNTDLFRGVLDMDEDTGYLVTRPDSTYTNVPGVFACGDVKDSVYRQAITAAGSGCMAAIDAERWLEDQHVTHRPPESLHGFVCGSPFGRLRLPAAYDIVRAKARRRGTEPIGSCERRPATGPPCDRCPSCRHSAPSAHGGRGTLAFGEWRPTTDGCTSPYPSKGP